VVTVITFSGDTEAIVARFFAMVTALMIAVASPIDLVKGAAC